MSYRCRQSRSEISTKGIKNHAFDTIPGFVWTARPDSELVYVSPNLLEYTGATLEQLKADRWLVVHPDDAKRRRIEWQRGRYLYGPDEDKIRFRARDGTYRYFYVRSEPLRDDRGDVVLLTGVLIDIDDQKKDEDALRKSEQSLRQTIDTIQALLCTSDPSGKTTYENKRVLEYSGRTLEEAMDQKWNNFIHPDDMELTGRAFGHAIQTGEPYEVIHRLRRADGEYRWHHSRGAPLCDENQQVLQWYNLAFDIDKGKRAEDELREMQSRLARVAQVATGAESSDAGLFGIKKIVAAEANKKMTRRGHSCEKSGAAKFGRTKIARAAQRVRATRTGPVWQYCLVAITVNKRQVNNGPSAQTDIAAMIQTSSAMPYPRRADSFMG
jgi:PAS domain S-box-containing protein